MMKELLVMVSEAFRKEYENTTGKIYRNLKSSVETFMIEDGIVTIIYTDKRSKVRTTMRIPEKHYIGCLEFDSVIDRNSFFNEDTVISGRDNNVTYGCLVRWADYSKSEVEIKEENIENVESILFERYNDGYIIINYCDSLEKRELKKLKLRKRFFIRLDIYENGQKVVTWYE